MSEKDDKFGNGNRFELLNSVGSMEDFPAMDVQNPKNNGKKRRKSKSRSPSNELVKMQSEIKALTLEIKKLREEKKVVEDKLNQILSQDQQFDNFSDIEIQDDCSDSFMRQNKPDNNKLKNNNFDYKFPALKEPQVVIENSVPSNTSQANSKPPKKNVPKTSKKLPPIFVCYNINTKEIKDKLFLLLKHNNFSFNIVNRNVTHISTCILEDYIKTKNFLNDSRINFYTFTPLEMKPYNFVINKLSTLFDEEEVTNYLNSLNLHFSIVNITKLSRNWLIQLSRDSNIDEFKSIRFILHCRVSIEPFKRSGPRQCKNCQRFTHVASNCNMPYRCVKCGESHGPNNCKLPPKDQNINEVILTDPNTGELVKRLGLPVKCINCGIEGHTANARNCPKRLEIIDRFKNKRQVYGMNKFGKSANSAMRTNTTYSSLFDNANKVVNINTNSKSKNTADNLNIFEALNNDCGRIFGKNFYSCLQKVGEFSQSYSKLNNDESRTKALFNLLISLKLNA